MIRFAPSKNPKKESRLFTILGILCLVLSFAVWFAAVASLAFSARGAILSHRIKNWALLVTAVIGGVVNVVVIFIDRG